MTTEATAGQGFHTLTADEHQRWARDFYKKHGFYPIAGGEAADVTAQPQAEGQGGGEDDGTTAEAKGGDGFNWGLFPNIPEDQRPLLEPHLKNVQAHVTKLEQQYAPFKDVNPEQVQQLSQFAQALESDPVQVWLELGERIQGVGEMEGLDYDALKAIVTGQDTGDDSEVAVEGGEEGPNPEIQSLKQELEAIKGETEKERQQRQQRVEQAFLAKQIDGIKTKLTEAGMEAPDEKEIVAKMIVHNGDVEAAAQSFVAHRDAVLKGFAEKSSSKKDVDMPEGSPKAAEKQPGKDPWSKARAGASSYLAKVNEAAAQE